MNERKIKKMDVEPLSKQEITWQTEQILNQVLPEKRSIWDTLKKIYLGPGLRVIFYHCESAWLVTVFIYLGICAVCLGFRRNALATMGFSVMAFPMCYLVFSFISCWLEEQEQMIDLKNSMHYSITHIVSLRMFYSSIVTIVFDVLLLAMNGYRGQELWKLGATGISSAFLFAVVSLYLYHLSGKSSSIGILLFLWTVLSSILVKLGNGFFVLLLDTIPLAVHAVVTACTLVSFILYIIPASETVFQIHRRSRVYTGNNHGKL